MVLVIGTGKPIQILCPMCGRGYKPYVFDKCPHCGYDVPIEYRPKQKKRRTAGRRKRKLKKTGK